jgi:myo-inositol-1(or 4)-monophosphatase
VLDNAIDTVRIIAAVQEGAELAFRKWRKGDVPDAKVWDKSKGHPVCDADLAVDLFLQQQLGLILPEAGWLSEETADNSERLNRQMLWVVDPIDGTRDYIRGRSGWCVSVALVVDGLPAFAVMAAPAEDKLWVATAGAGVVCNGEKLAGSTRSKFAGSRVPADDLPLVDRDLSLVHKPNSIAMRMTMVACDRADLVASLRWGNEWDIAAAHLIAQEAGTMVTNALGQPIRYNKSTPLDFGLICCASGIHKAAVERLAGRAAGLLRTKPA